MRKYIPYTYLIGWSKLDRWYYGVQYGYKYPRAHPTNLWTIYFTSCQLVEEYRQLYGEPDVMQIRRTFKNAKQAIDWEASVLQRLKAASNERWLNRNVKGSIYRTKESYIEAGKKVSSTKKRQMELGLKDYVAIGRYASSCCKPWSNERRLKQSQTLKGRKKPEGFGLKVSQAQRGKPKSEEHKQKLSAATKAWHQRRSTKVVI